MQIYKREYFEHSIKKGIFWTKLIFKTNEQERDFMISFEGMPVSLKKHTQVHDGQLTVQNTSFKVLRPSPSNPKFPLFKLKASCYICSNMGNVFYQ